MIRYDFSRPNMIATQFHGIIPLKDIHSHAGLLQSVFLIEPNSQESLQKLQLRFIQAYPTSVHIVPYDPRLKIKEYSLDLALHLDPPWQVLEAFSNKIDFNSKYDLKSDVVMSEDDLLRIPRVSAGFFLPIERRRYSGFKLQLVGSN